MILIPLPIAYYLLLAYGLINLNLQRKVSWFTKNPKGKWWGGPLERYKQGNFSAKDGQLVSSKEWKQNMILGRGF